jgi:ribosome-binding factor A
MSRRTERVSSVIQQELAQMILSELNDPRLTGLPTVTRVKVSDDLSIADVFVTVMGTEGQKTAALNALRHSAGLMRTKLTKALTLRVAPYLKFHYDEDLKKELELLDALRKASEETAELDRRRQEAASAQAQPNAEAQPPGGTHANPGQ